jgi:hypothetical protein
MSYVHLFVDRVHQGRKLRALAVTTATRSEAMPDIPSIGDFRTVTALGISTRQQGGAQPSTSGQGAGAEAQGAQPSQSGTQPSTNARRNRMQSSPGTQGTGAGPQGTERKQPVNHGGNPAAAGAVSSRNSRREAAPTLLGLVRIDRLARAG